MAVTSPDSIYSPDPNTPYNYIVDMRTMANSTQIALNSTKAEITNLESKVTSVTNVNIVPISGSGFTLGTARITVVNGVAHFSGLFGRDGATTTITSSYQPIAYVDRAAEWMFPRNRSVPVASVNVLGQLEGIFQDVGSAFVFSVRTPQAGTTVNIFSYSSFGPSGASWLVNR